MALTASVALQSQSNPRDPLWYLTYRTCLDSAASSGPDRRLCCPGRKESAVSFLRPALAAALFAAAPAFAQDHQHEGQAAPAPQTPQPNASCPMMKGMMNGQPGGTMPMPQDKRDGTAPAPGAGGMPMAPGKMADMPCMKKPTTAPEPPHDHNHPAGQ